MIDTSCFFVWGNKLYQTRISDIYLTRLWLQFRTSTEIERSCFTSNQFIFFLYSKTETNTKFLHILDSLDLRGLLGERHLGGVRHFSITSSAFVLDGTGSATNNRSVLPSSTPLPSHLPHGNLTKERHTNSSYSSSVCKYFYKGALNQGCCKRLYFSPVCLPGTFIPD